MTARSRRAARRTTDNHLAASLIADHIQLARGTGRRRYHFPTAEIPASHCVGKMEQSSSS
jgi:hypothetical protein